MQKTTWKPIKKHEIKKGDIIKCKFKNKVFIGKILDVNPQQWARLTSGRFIAISCIQQTGSDKMNRSNLGHGMPYTDNAKYEKESTGDEI